MECAAAAAGAARPAVAPLVVLALALLQLLCSPPRENLQVGRPGCEGGVRGETRGGIEEARRRGGDVRPCALLQPAAAGCSWRCRRGPWRKTDEAWMDEWGSARGRRGAGGSRPGEERTLSRGIRGMRFRATFGATSPETPPTRRHDDSCHARARGRRSNGGDARNRSNRMRKTDPAHPASQHELQPNIPPLSRRDGISFTSMQRQVLLVGEERLHLLLSPLQITLEFRSEMWTFALLLWGRSTYEGFYSST